MKVSSRTLEITVISGENVNVKDDEAYVVVRAESIKCCTTKMVKDSTTTSSTIGLCNKGNNNNNCWSFLSWNEKLLLDVPLHARSITFEVQSKKSKGNGKPVGVARIAISEILRGCNGDQVKGSDEDDSNLHVLSYRLRDWDGRRNGVIHFAVSTAATTTTVVTVPKELSVAAKPMEKDSDHKKKKFGEVVLGVPLWWNFPNII